MEEKAKLWGSSVEISNVTDDLGTLGLAGPRSRDILSRVTDVDLSEEGYPFLHTCTINVAGVPCRAMRISYTGELGWELYMQRSNIVDVYSALMSAGQDLGIGDFGTFAMNSMRLEKGFRAWGLEVSSFFFSRNI